jgi:hypothetical protein
MRAILDETGKMAFERNVRRRDDTQPQQDRA